MKANRLKSDSVVLGHSAGSYTVYTTEKTKEGYIRLYGEMQYIRQTACYIIFKCFVNDQIIRLKKKYIDEIVDNQGRHVIY